MVGMIGLPADNIRQSTAHLLTTYHKNEFLFKMDAWSKTAYVINDVGIL